jgi:hypothetical protein
LQSPLPGTKKAMTRLLPTVAIMGSWGPTGPRFWIKSLAQAGVLAAQKATRAPAVANFKKLRESGNIVESPLEWLLKIVLSMEVILAARSDLRCGD